MVIPDYLSIREAAAALHLTRRAAEEHVARRKILSVRPMGGRVLIPASELARIIAEGTRPALRLVRPAVGRLGRS